MGLRRTGMVENTSGTTVLSLRAEAGESILVRDIETFNAGFDGEDTKVKVDRKSILQFKMPRDFWFLGGYPTNSIGAYRDNLQAVGLWPSIPIAEGQEMTITAPGSSDYMHVVYDLYDAGDIRKTDDNGTEARRYRMFQVISNSAAPTEAGDVPLDQSNLDSEFVGFPGGEVVPQNTEIHLLGLIGCPVSKGTGAANAQYTTYIRMLVDRVDIFDKDMDGMLFLGKADYTTASVNYKNLGGMLTTPGNLGTTRIRIFEEAIVFSAGTELNVFVTIVETTGGSDFVAGDIFLCLILDIIKL